MADDKLGAAAPGRRPAAKPRGAAPAATGLKIELRPAAELTPYPRNARKHSPAQVAEIMASIREFGFTTPILADAFIRAGHGRTLAALRLYQAGESIRLPNGKVLPAGTVPVIDCSDWSEAQKRAYVIADNKLGENAGWDDELLRLELGELKELGVDHTLLGFSDRDLRALLEAETAGAGDGQASAAGDGPAAAYRVLVECESAAQQAECLKLMAEAGVKAWASSPTGDFNIIELKRGAKAVMS